MAEKEEEENLLATPQEHALMCEKHYLMPIDITCEDCEDFICSACVKEDHKDHNWQTIQTAATLKTRGLLESLGKIEENDIHQIDKKIQRTSEQMEENKKKCDFELMMFQRHCDSIVVKLTEIKKKHEKTLRDSLECKNHEVKKNKSGLGEKKRGILQCITAIRKNGSTMTDITFLRTHREMTKLLSAEDDDSKENIYFSMGYKTGDIHEAVLECMMGYIFNVEEITVTQTNSFQCGDEYIMFLKAINEDTCLLRHTELPYLEQVTKNGKTEKQFNVDVNDVCFTSDKEIYVTTIGDKSICRLSLSGLVSAVFSTDPFEPTGICLTMDGNLMLTLSDTESELYEINSRSRRLVRHVTLTGDIIREYEYHEDGQTRLFTDPRRITQNGNTDICVINWTSISISELVLLSLSGSLKSVYHGQDQRKDFIATDVVCDTYFNIIVSELQNSKIHLLSPDGEFLRYLLTKNQIDHPFALSLKKTTLWIGGNKGLVKVFQYKT